MKLPPNLRAPGAWTVPPLLPPSFLGTYRGYTLKRVGAAVVAVKYGTDAHGNTVTLHRLVGDFANTLEAKNAVDAALA